MGTISQKLEYLDTTREKIKDGINALGGELTNQSTFRSYANVLNDLYEVFPKVESEEKTSAITLSPTQKAKMKLTLKGNIEQDGEPTPTNPIDIHIVSGDNEIKVCNKNLLGLTDFSGTFKTTNLTNMGTYLKVKNKYNVARTLDITTNTYKSTRTNDYDNSQIWHFYGLNPNTQYTISCNISTSKTEGNMYVFSSLPYTTTNTSAKFTTDSNGEYEYISMFYESNATSGTYIELSNLQLEQGSTATDYVEHKEYTKEINLGNLEVGSIGEYEDEFFKNTIDSKYYDSTLLQDKWYLKKRIGKVVLDGSENWITRTNLVGTLQMQCPTNANNIMSGETGQICNYANYKYGTFNSGRVGEFNLLYNTKNILIGVEDGTTVENFKNKISSNNLICYYPLATPENILLNDTLQETLDSFVSYQEQTNISQGNNDLPFIIKASALKDFTTLE